MKARSQADVMANLPEVWAESLLPEIRSQYQRSGHKLVVLDDDPTGTQTVYDIPVLTEWSVASLEAELANDLPCFYLLTNSRSLGAEAARALNLEIAENLKTAAKATGRSVDVVSRSDSTLRGHFPLETDVLHEALGPFDGVLLIPYFQAGGRLTIDDVHYVLEGETLVPAAETPFASDATFGYTQSALPDWVEEKTGGRVSASAVRSLSLRVVRESGPSAVADWLKAFADFEVGVINAADPRDLEVVVAGLQRAEAAGKRFLFRTGAQFVSTRIGLAERPCWQPSSPSSENSGTGGLVVVGSHVPKSTQQLETLLASGEVEGLELEVDRLLNAELGDLEVVERVNQGLLQGRDLVVYTSRTLVRGDDAEASLAIARRVSAALVELVQGLEVRPRYLIGKGGITSSDLASRGLGVRRAMVKGPLLPGVPVWETDATTRFPGMPYVVFPGNVGDETALLEAVRRFR